MVVKKFTFAISSPDEFLLNVLVVPAETTKLEMWANAQRDGRPAILWAHVEQILLLNKFFSDCRYMP